MHRLPTTKRSALCMWEGETERTLLNHMHPVNLPRPGPQPKLPSTHKNTKPHDSLFPAFFSFFILIKITPEKKMSPPSELFPKYKIKSSALRRYHFTGRPSLRKEADWELVGQETDKRRGSRGKTFCSHQFVFHLCANSTRRRSWISRKKDPPVAPT